MASFPPPASVSDFEAVLRRLEDVQGWLTADQAQRLWEASRGLAPPATVVEIGSYHGRSTVVLAHAAPEGVHVVAIDPHAGHDRGPREIHGTAAAGQSDHERFLHNLRQGGVAERVRHVRKRSQDALDDVDGPVDLLYIDGAHRFRPALADISGWGARVHEGGTMFIHDSFNAVGVTLAQLTTLVPGKRFRFVRRTGSLSEYRREELPGRQRVANAVRQLAQLGYFARSIGIKLALVARLRPLARLLGHRTDDPWPY
ncbi:MAG: class I SAM-dependent methyltransferase [Actinomycetota bacterium]|nr:class I SAM-dependent methyltransferase [Actinomycetota bacterium]